MQSVRTVSSDPFFSYMVINSHHLKVSISLLSVLLFFNFFSGVGFAQINHDTLTLRNQTLQYIDKIDTIISLKLNLNTEYDQFEVRGDNFYYDLRPNISLSSKLSFGYRFLSFGIGFKPKFIHGNNDNDLKGVSKGISLGINIITDHWLQDGQFVSAKGFYLHNTVDYNPEWVKGTDPYIQFPELKFASISGFTGYKFNKNFSLKSISSKTEIQLKSCGSFIPYIVYNYYETDNFSKNLDQQSSQKSNNFNAVASLSYLYAFVFRSKYYTSIGLTPGIGFQYTNLLTRFTTNSLRTHSSSPLYWLKEQVAAGYNSRKFFIGGEISLAQASHSQANTTVQTKATRTFFQIFTGFRFNTPKFLKQKTDAVKRIVPVKLQKIIE